MDTGKLASTLAFVSLTAALGAFAQAPAQTPSLPRGDVKFLQKAAGDGMAEVELGNLAKSRGMSDEVKQFGARMAEDHGKAGEELKTVASAHGVTLPTGIDKKHQKLIDKLQKLSGPDFDRAYMKEMVADHREDVKSFKEHASSKNDNDVKQFAAKTLPTLQVHLESALATNDIVAGSKRTGDRVTGSTKK